MHKLAYYQGTSTRRKLRDLFCLWRI